MGNLTASVGTCKGGPLDGRLLARMNERRHEREGGAYVYQPPKGMGNGTWLWLPAKKDAVQ